MTQDLDRLLNRAEMRGNLPVGEIRPLIERVKEAERMWQVKAQELSQLQDRTDETGWAKARAYRNLEARLRAAEEVLRVADEYLLLGPPARAALRDALDTYDKKRKQ